MKQAKASQWQGYGAPGVRLVVTDTYPDDVIVYLQGPRGGHVREGLSVPIAELRRALAELEAK